MVLILEKKKTGLGQPPLVFMVKDGKGFIANPNTSLAQTGVTVKWSCNDWMLWHKSLIKLFMGGYTTSKIKYTQEKATELSNQVFLQHWAKASVLLTGCGFSEDFYKYFNSVGLASIFNVSHRLKHGAIDKGTKVVDSVSDTFVNVVDDAGDIVTGVTGTVGNVAGMAKYAVPVLIGGVVLFVGAYAYKNFIKGDERVQVGPVKV